LSPGIDTKGMMKIEILGEKKLRWNSFSGSMLRMERSAMEDYDVGAA